MGAIDKGGQSAWRARAIQTARLAAALVCVGVFAGFRAGAALAQSQAGASAPASNAEHAANAPDVPRKNWYNDPFFALSNAIGGCPQPLGPRMTKAEADDDAHYRVERGTTCWLAHKCSKPNSYLYDADIAAAIRQRLQGDALFAGTSIWITVQRRFVYAEGCAGPGFDSAALERRLAAIPDVEQVFVRVSSDPQGALPYKTLSTPP
ncbi:BON domain-containing protein [Paraburkholderia sp. CNPSo 3076]|uniref:BON domain-containing protein n=1 Tax=Paraburkholderia sp. CNPSo 3076 TaxID=2940936 RepID=UPI00225A8A0C|nr:BON domain-containing protein [Paraburkholderia sp. CNPSo 3076]MCX5543588.1 BON domain-containing protein [Paraburkholderia sp. CNPSo 3076]